MNSFRPVARLLSSTSRSSSRQLVTSSVFPPLCAGAAVAPGVGGLPRQDPFQLTKSEVQTLVEEIHHELDTEIHVGCQMREISKYYFDGQGKAIRPVIALCLGHAFNHHTGAGEETVKNQRRVAIISEMIHTASLVHDDVVDHAVGGIFCADSSLEVHLYKLR